jgi:Zn-dependent protease with chaperone function
MKSPILIAALLATGSAYGSKHLPPDVVIWVHGELAVPSAVDQEARARMSWIYRRGGIRLAWREAQPPAPEGQVLIELRYAKDAPPGISSGALAYALPFGEGEATVVVFYDRIRYVAGRSSREAVLLAHVLAHEIGHILERTDVHTSIGIMKAHWSAHDYDAMERGSLQFAPDDFDLIRLGLASLKSRCPGASAKRCRRPGNAAGI